MTRVPISVTLYGSFSVRNYRLLQLFIWKSEFRFKNDEELRHPKAFHHFRPDVLQSATLISDLIKALNLPLHIDL